MRIRRVVFAAVIMVSAIISAEEHVCSPVQTVADFIVALKAGNREAAAKLFAPCEGEAREHVGKWLDKAMPFFASGKVESKAENVCFIDGDVAISPIRQWRPGNPDIYEIELTGLVFVGGKWLLLPDLDKFNSPVNSELLPSERNKRFENLWHLFCDFKRIHKDKVRKAREEQNLKKLQQEYGKQNQ
ncbi:MAG: hypothetical protein IJS15_02480 [Victivallales bacterium]|nr:hypothetical protein [Victivallales bacterium]